MKIRRADITDRQSILDFIEKNWQEDHIFVRWPELFDDYHREGDRLNYMLAVDEADGKLYGVCGFIFANHAPAPDVWLALWKVIPSGIPGLGMDLIRRLQEELHCRILACCGIRREVCRLYEFLGYQTGTLRHFYRLNENMTYRIASIVQDEMPALAKTNGAEWIPISSEEEFDAVVPYGSEAFTERYPYKEKEYVKKTAEWLMR